MHRSDLGIFTLLHQANYFRRSGAKLNIHYSMMAFIIVYSIYVLIHPAKAGHAWTYEASTQAIKWLNFISETTFTDSVMTINV